MVKFQPNLDNNDPWFIIEDEDLRHPRLLAREIVGFLSVVRATSSLLGRVKRSGRVVNMPEVQRTLRDVMVAWFRNANYRIGGMRSRNGRSAWVNERERLFRTYRNVSGTLQENVAEMYRKRFQGDIRKDIHALYMPWHAAETIPEIAFENAKEIERESLLPESRRGSHRHFRIVMDPRAEGYYTIEVTMPMTYRSFVEARDRGDNIWKRVAALFFADPVTGAQVMKNLAGHKEINLDRTAEFSKRMRLESGFGRVLEGEARRKGIVEERRDRRDDDDDDDDDDGDNNQQQQQQQQQQQNAPPPEMIDLYRARMEGFLKLSDADKAAFGAFGGWVDPAYPEPNLHDLMDIMYAYFPFVKLFFEVDNPRELFKYTSILVHWHPDMFLVYERNVNTPILLAMHLLSEQLWRIDDAHVMTIGDCLRDSMRELKRDQNMAGAVKCSYFYYRLLGLVVGFYGVMESKGIYDEPSNINGTAVFTDRLRFARILGVFDPIEQGAEPDMQRNVVMNDLDMIGNNVSFQVQDQNSREPRLSFAYPINQETIRGNSRVAIQHELAPFFSGTIDQLTQATIVRRYGDEDGAEHLDVGVAFPEEFFHSDVFGDLLRPCDPNMFYTFLQAVRGGAMAALIKLRNMRRIHPERNEMSWRCRFVRPVEERDLDIDVSVNPNSLDDPVGDPGNASHAPQYFRDKLVSFPVVPQTNYGKRIVSYVYGTSQYVSDVDDYSDRVPEPDFQLLRFIAEDCRYVGKVSVSRGESWSVHRVNQWDSSMWKKVTTPPMLRKYTRSLSRMIMFDGDSCFYKAMNCTCSVSGMVPQFCKCEGAKKEAGEVTLGEIPDLIKRKWPDKAVMVVAFLVVSKFDGRSEEKRKYGEMIRVVYQSAGFYEENENTVVLIGVPEWEGGVGHCAVWRNKWEREDEDDINRFRYMKEFNLFLRTYLCNPQEVCPICGTMYMFGTDNLHYIKDHNYFNCVDCGFPFETKEQLEEHQKYHCKKPRYGAKLELKDDDVVYKDKGRLGSDTVVIYADLESAIDKSGKHNNILAGWVVMDDKKEVKIERTDSEGRAVVKMLCQWANVKGRELLIYFHNGKGYDFHFIIEEMCRMGTVFKEFEIIADSSEKVSYFQCKYRNKVLKFRDTFAFVTTSLEKWTESTVASGCTFPVYTHTFDGQDEKREFMRKKNPFPYAAIEKAEDLDQGFVEMIAWALSAKAEELFCFKYKKEELRDLATYWMRKFDDYGWQRVMDYYCDYLRCDVSQLADNMEFFRKAVLDEFDVDPHQYFGTPSLSWAIWMKSVSGNPEMKMELVTSPLAYDIINSSIRGGQTGAMTRLYDVADEPDTFVCDLDCNSLYPTVMKYFSFPVRGWEVTNFTNPDDCSDGDAVARGLDQMHKGGKSGFIEVDFDVVDDEQFYSYVPIASKRTVSGVYETQAMVEYCEEYGQDVDHVFFSGLTQVMGRHEHYCCHTRLLQWYLEHKVIRLLKMHRIVTGVDAPVFRDYVTRNLEKRAEAGRKHDPIKKMLYKLMNNSLYGKTYEDVTKRSSFELVRKEDFAEMDPAVVYREVRDFAGGWKLIETKKLTCELNKPFYLGAAITEFSKLWMYRFFYDRIRKVFPYPKTEVFYTDTDALTICFRGCGITSMRELATRLNKPTPDQQIIDTSNFNTPMLGEEHNAHNEEAGLFKSETGEARILRMVALRAKTYVMECEGGEIKMSVKGCPMVEKSRLSFDMFKEILMGGQIPYEIHFNAIRSEGHLVYNRELSRVVLSADDRKRYILPDHIHTAPLFSKVHLEALGKIRIPDDFELTF